MSTSSPCLHYYERSTSSLPRTTQCPPIWTLTLPLTLLQPVLHSLPGLVRSWHFSPQKSFPLHSKWKLKSLPGHTGLHLIWLQPTPIIVSVTILPDSFCFSPTQGYFWNMSCTFSPWGLCTCCSPSLDCSFPRYRHGPLSHFIQSLLQMSPQSWQSLFWPLCLKQYPSLLSVLSSWCIFFFALIT